MNLYSLLELLIDINSDIPGVDQGEVKIFKKRLKVLMKETALKEKEDAKRNIRIEKALNAIARK